MVILSSREEIRFFFLRSLNWRHTALAMSNQRANLLTLNTNNRSRMSEINNNNNNNNYKTGRKEMFYLTMHSTHFIYGYMALELQKNTSIAFT